MHGDKKNKGSHIKSYYLKFNRLYIQFFIFFLYAISPPQGMKYKQYVTIVPQSIHVLEVDPKLFTITSVRALDQAVGREDVLSIVKRKEALVGINAGFFSTGRYEGVSSGILRIHDRWYGLPSKPRGAIGWNNHKVLFDRLLIHIEGINIVVDSQTGKTNSDEWKEMDFIVGGTPLLIQNGEKVINFLPEETIDSFLFLRHARTAVGVLPNGNWLFVIVDGKQPGFSIGMTMKELADFMENIGCINALNLDGGGSTTLVYDNAVMNKPTGDGDDNDEGERILRPVSDAIIVKPKPL